MATGGAVTYRTRVELVVAALIAATAILFLWQTAEITVSSLHPIGPRVFPVALAAIMLIGGVLLALRAILGPNPPESADFGFRESDVVKLSLIVGSGVIFLVCFWAFGYFVATLTSVMLMMVAFGNRDPLTVVAAAVAVSVAYQALFMGAMNLFDPPGQVVDLRRYTNWLSAAN